MTRGEINCELYTAELYDDEFLSHAVEQEHDYYRWLHEELRRDPNPYQDNEEQWNY